MTSMRRCFLFALALMLLVGCGRSVEPMPDATVSRVTVVQTPAAKPPTSTPLPTSTPVPPTARPTLATATIAATTAAATSTPSVRYNAPGDHFVQVISGSQERGFRLHVPPNYEPGIPLPLVIDLHGLGSNASQQERLSQMSAKADQEGFVVVYPQAVGAPAAWYTGVGAETIADVIFLRDLIDFLQERLAIDPERVYATGFSNGGGMANRLGCAIAGKLAAIASVSGAYLLGESCRPDRPLPVLAFHGTDDKVVPYEGDQFLPPVRDWAAAWAERNGCEPEPDVVYQQGGVVGESWQGCEQGADVTLYTIEGGGHVWPGSGLAGIAEAGERGIDATDVIWEFFEAHPRP
jgi:polyhydroxybutyrate depolymerase